MNNHDGHVRFGCPGGLRRGLLACCVIGLASSCASQAPVQEDVVSEQLDTHIVRDGTIRHDIKDKEVARLWQESEIFRQAGDATNARATLQEAIQLAPQDAVLWSRAAEFELELNSNLRAENYAAKSNILSTKGNQPLQYRNWLIIQRAREGRGDLLGAREAELESRKVNP